MSNPIQRQIKAHLMNFAAREDIHLKADGSVEVRFAYFYSHGNTAQKWADKVRAALPFPMSVMPRDDYRQWPKTSYFVAVIRPGEIAEPAPLAGPGGQPLYIGQAIKALAGQEVRIVVRQSNVERTGTLMVRLSGAFKTLGDFTIYELAQVDAVLGNRITIK